MALTAEIRFWWPNKQTAVLTGWLNEKGIVLAAAVERTDGYFRTGTAELNLKQRDQEKLEVKSLVRSLLLPKSFACATQAQLWVKHKASEFQISRNIATPVKKRRWLIYLDDNGQAVTTDAKLSSGCQIELSEIQPDGQLQIWTSFCLEAFGDPDLVLGYLAAAIEKLDDLPCANEKPLIASYPEWLLQEDYFENE